jgi:hypothetical protein
MLFPKDSIAVTGEPKTYTAAGGSGNPLHRLFCTNCGSPVFARSDQSPRMFIMAGTLDDKSLFKPEVSIFCDSAPSWAVMPQDAQNFPRYFT